MKYYMVLSIMRKDRGGWGFNPAFWESDSSRIEKPTTQSNVLHLTLCCRSFETEVTYPSRPLWDPPRLCCKVLFPHDFQTSPQAQALLKPPDVAWKFLDLLHMLLTGCRKWPLMPKPSMPPSLLPSQFPWYTRCLQGRRPALKFPERKQGGRTSPVKSVLFKFQRKFWHILLIP